MVQKYQNEISPILYYGISTKTNEKDLKIPNLQPPNWKSPYWMTLYVCNLSSINVKIDGPNLAYLTTPAHDTQIEFIICTQLWVNCSYILCWHACQCSKLTHLYPISKEIINHGFNLLNETFIWPISWRFLLSLVFQRRWTFGWWDEERQTVQCSCGVGV